MKHFLLLLAMLATAVASFAQRPTYIHNERFAGGQLYAEGALNIVFWGTPQLEQKKGLSASTGDVLEASWKHDNGASVNPMVVRLERAEGQSIEGFVAAFHAMVQAHLELYPPNVAPDSNQGIVFGMGPQSALPPDAMPMTGTDAGEGQQDTMSVSWKHDPDGDGPLNPITVTASTEKRSGETSREQARRLKQMSDALMAIYPPNVPEKKVG